MIKAVLDTNVVVSANLTAEGLEALTLDLAANRKIQIYVSPTILLEYETVLRRGKFKLAKENIDAALRLLEKISVVITKLPVVKQSPDFADNNFLACAEASNADFLVTGNAKHFPKQWKTTRVVNARQFLDIIGPFLLSNNENTYE